MAIMTFSFPLTLSFPNLEPVINFKDHVKEDTAGMALQAVDTGSSCYPISKICVDVFNTKQYLLAIVDFAALLSEFFGFCGC